MKTIFICSLPRTGSTLLSADMRSTHSLGEPREYFHPNKYGKFVDQWDLPTNDLDAYIAALKKRTVSDNGVIAIKLFMGHLKWLRKQGMLDGNQGNLTELSDRFGGAIVVKLQRRDKLRQAISLVKARQSGQWGSKGKSKVAPEFSDDQLSKAIVEIVRFESLWEREFQTAGITPSLTITYEDFTAARNEWLLHIAEEVGLDNAAEIVANRAREDVVLERQANAENEQWYDRFARKG